MNAERPITKNMKIYETMKRFPKTEETFIKYGLHCVGCEVSTIETIEVAATTHGIKNLEGLLDDLNEAASA